VGTVVAVTAVLAALTFGASFLRLVTSPAQYGQNWNVQLDLGFGSLPKAVIGKIVAAEHGVTGYAAGNYGQLSVAGHPTPAIGIDAIRGAGYVTLLAGREPAGPDEIVLGARTMRAARASIGDQVTVTINGRARRMRVVGVGVFASFSRGTFTGTDLGDGAAVDASLLAQRFQQTGCVAQVTCYNFLLVRYRPGSAAGAAARLMALATRAGCPPTACSVSGDQKPSDIRDYAGVRDTPLVLGGVLSLLAIGTIAHVLATSVRRRRRDLALFKTLGLRRSQVLCVVCWQATALVAAALAPALPLGIVAGRWSWALFADSVGVAPDASVPMSLAPLTIAATLLLANLVALGPGWASARIRPAQILRAE
jgi:putative ABC transport system permease protein